MKQLLFSSLALSLFLISCADKCKDVNCLNGGACNDGSCVCLTGFGGDYCETTLEECYTCLKYEYCLKGKITCSGTDNDINDCFATETQRDSWVVNFQSSAENAGCTWTLISTDDNLVDDTEVCEVPSEIDDEVDALEADGYDCTKQ